MAKNSGSSASKDGTQVRVFSFAANEDAVVPDGWDIVSVEHDRQMGITRVVASQPYDAEKAAEEKAAAAGPVATPTYPQTAGPTNVPPAPPNTSFPWGSLDTTKADNVETLKQIPEALMPEGLAPHPVQGMTGDPAGLPPEAVEHDIAADDVEARSKATRSAEAGEKTETPVEGMTTPEDSPKNPPDQA